MTRSTLPALALLLALPSTGTADDWPQFRGPHRDGVSTETGLADSWPSDGPSIEWAIESVGEGYGAVAVADGRVYVQGTQGSDSVVFALDEDRGTTLWTTPLGRWLRQDRGNGPRSTPTVVGDEIYVLTEAGVLARLNAEDGSVVWSFSITERFDTRNSTWHISESPLVDGDRVLVMPGGRGGSIVALDRETGRTIWRSSDLTDDMSYSSLIAAELVGVHTIVGFTGDAGVGVRASDGTLLWSYDAPANRTANAAMPVVGGDRVFFSSSYGVGGGAVDISLDDTGLRAEEAYFASSLQNHHGGVVLHDGYLYAMFGRALACVDFETGEIVWRARSVGKGSLTIADDKLFLLGEDHEVGLAHASPKGYEELGRFQIRRRGWPSWAYPVVANGRLFLRNMEGLTAYDVTADRSAGTSGR